jgi:hypothetical protein
MTLCRSSRPQNFLINVAQAQLNGQLVADDGSFTNAGLFLDRVDIFFTSIFTAELVLNAYAHWFIPFATNPYNLIDSVVIMLSLVSLGPLEIPVSILRVIRAFRVIRIFGRLSALKNIIATLSASLIPVFNAFLLVILFMSICASLALSPLPCSLSVPLVPLPSSTFFPLRPSFHPASRGETTGSSFRTILVSATWWITCA